MNADQSLQKLIEGNQRYVADAANGELSVAIQRQAVSAGQAPFAVILGCSDSRVPAELVFHCGVGELFVVRVAGNVVAPMQIGSVEYACQHLGAQLVVVLGHSHCGAVAATVDALTQGADGLSDYIGAIVQQITPAVKLVASSNEHNMDKEALLDRAVRANVVQSVESLRSHSVVLEDLVQKGNLKIIGAEYSLETGVVDFHLGD